MVNDQNGVFGRRTRWGAMLTIAAVLTLSLDAASQDGASAPTTTPDVDETQSRKIAEQLADVLSLMG